MWDRVIHSIMPVDSEDTSRTAVKTYVPVYQKEEWQEHADELDMSQSEFVRSMVQAGRRGFLDEESSEESSPEESPRDEATPLEQRVESALTTHEYHSWEELLAAITGDIEDRLEETLAELQEQNIVRYSGRNGGYTLVET